MDRWMDGCKSKEMTTKDREDCRKDTGGGMAEDPVRGGGAVGSGQWERVWLLVQWCSGAVVPGWLLLVFRCGADGTWWTMDQTLGDSKTARIRGRAQSSMGTAMED
jgi:hypothetical protein